MKKQDLKTGMIVKTRDKILSTVIISEIFNNGYLIDKNGIYSKMEYLNEDLISQTSIMKDIMEVYKPTKPSAIIDHESKTLIWERTNTQER